MWTRSDPIRQNRECVIPDISRTFHFGARGLNMNAYFQELYFKNHAINTRPNVKLKDVDKWAHQQTQNMCMTFVQYWANVEDVGPPLYKW